MSDRLVWIDCEMTGLDLIADALIEVAALVTDFDLNVLGDGIDIVIKPPGEAIAQMDPYVRTMHERSGLLEELDGGTTLAMAEAQVLAYIKEHCADGSRPPLAGNTVATDRSFLIRDMPNLESFLHYRIVDVSSIKELSRRWFPRAYFHAPAEARQPPRARRHPGEHRGAALLPRGGLRGAARARQRECEGAGRQARRRPDRPRPGRRPSRRAPTPATPRARIPRRGPAPSRLHSASAPLAGVPRSMVGVAQLVERRVVVADVAGSSPVTHPKARRPSPCRVGRRRASLRV